jgi:uncharacterized LabA/DUF88 family protein
MDTKIQSCYVFIDAGYLSKISEHFAGEGNYIKYDLQQLPITLAKAKNLWCEKVYYYTAPPYLSSSPSKEESERRRRHDNFVENVLKKKFGWEVREGRCQKGDKENDYHQKGVDNLIDIDLMDLCQKNAVKTVLMLICDTDFVPILNKIRKEWQIKVVIAYFTDRIRRSEFSMSNHLLTACDDTLLIEKNHFNIIGIKKKYTS